MPQTRPKTKREPGTIIDPKAAKEIRAILSALSAATKKQLDQVESQRAQLDGDLSEMGEMESLRLQMMMDRISKMMTTLSNLLKKMQDTSETITQNLK